jgi:hypothetical protein
MYKRLLLLASIATIWSCSTSQNIGSNSEKTDPIAATSSDLKKIQVLNFGTFHMGEASDKNKTDFDEKIKNNKMQSERLLIN